MRATVWAFRRLAGFSLERAVRRAVQSRRSGTFQLTNSCAVRAQLVAGQHVGVAQGGVYQRHARRARRDQSQRQSHRHGEQSRGGKLFGDPDVHQPDFARHAIRFRSRSRSCSRCGVSPASGFTAVGPVGGPFSADFAKFRDDQSWRDLAEMERRQHVLLADGFADRRLAGGGRPDQFDRGFVIVSELTGGGGLFREHACSPIQTDSRRDSIRPFGGTAAWCKTADLKPAISPAGRNPATLLTRRSSAAIRNYVHSGTYGASWGRPARWVIFPRTVTTVAGQNYLLSLWLSSPDGRHAERIQRALERKQDLRPVEPAASSAGPTCNFWSRPPVPATVLQFGFQDDPAYFGLDDVSVTPWWRRRSNPPCKARQQFPTGLEHHHRPRLSSPIQNQSHSRTTGSISARPSPRPVPS